MTKKGKKFLLAASFGDGYIRERGNYYSICIRHSEKQREYIEYKAAMISEAIGREVNVTEFDNSGKVGYRFEVSVPYLKFVRKWLYKGGRKKITMSFLRKLDDLGVALWYMDDGSLVAKKRQGKIHAYDLTFSTYCSEDEALCCIAFFQERYGVRFTLKRNKELFSIRCGTKEAKKLLAVLEPYLIPSMKYKSFQTVTT